MGGDHVGIELKNALAACLSGNNNCRVGTAPVGWRDGAAGPVGWEDNVAGPMVWKEGAAGPVFCTEG